MLAACVFAGCARDERLPITDASGHVPDLACPGDVGCKDGGGPLKVGVALVPITARVETWDDLDGDGLRGKDEPFDDLNGNGVWDPVWMAGFGNGRAATGIADDNWARVLTLSQGDLHLAIVALDLIGYFHDSVVATRQAIADAGFDFDDVLVVSTHQHEGPDTMGPWGASPLERGVDPAYLDRLIADTVRALDLAVRSEVECSIAVGQGDASALVNDSRLPNVVDPTLTAIAFRSGSQVRATLTIWGNHPETLGSRNTRITSDYPHTLRDRMEEAFPGSIALFVPGTLGGLMNPLHVPGCPDANGQPTCDDETFEKAAYIGDGAAKVAIAALNATPHVEDRPRLGVRRHAFFASVQNVRFIAGFATGVLERVIFDADHQPIPPQVAMGIPLEDASAGAILLQTEVDAVSLGPIELVTVPGEIYPELWLQGPDGGSLVEHPDGADYPDAETEPPIAGALPATVPLKAIINQANDALGYIIPKAQFDLVAPHAYKEDGQYGEENALGPEIAGDVRRAVEALYAPRASGARSEPLRAESGARAPPERAPRASGARSEPLRAESGARAPPERAPRASGARSEPLRAESGARAPPERAPRASGARSEPLRAESGARAPPERAPRASGARRD